MGQRASKPPISSADCLPRPPAIRPTATFPPIITSLEPEQPSRPRSPKKTAPHRPQLSSRGLFSPAPPTYLTPSTPKYLRRLYVLHGGPVVPDVLGAQLILVNSLDDRLIPSLYVEKVVVYDCAWIEESFVKGQMMDLKGFAVLPWDYDGPARWIPEELISGLGWTDEWLLWAVSVGLQGSDKAGDGLEDCSRFVNAEPVQEAGAQGDDHPLRVEEEVHARMVNLSDDEDAEHLPSEPDLLQELSTTAQPISNSMSGVVSRASRSMPLHQAPQDLQDAPAVQRPTSFFTPHSRQTVKARPPLPPNSRSALSPTLRNPLSIKPSHSPPSMQRSRLSGSSQPTLRTSTTSTERRAPVSAHDTMSPKCKSGSSIDPNFHPLKRYRSHAALCDPPLSLTIGNNVITPKHASGALRPRPALQAKPTNVVRSIGQVSVSASASGSASKPSPMQYPPTGPRPFVPGRTLDMNGAVLGDPAIQQAGPSENLLPASRPRKIFRNV